MRKLLPVLFALALLVSACGGDDADTGADPGTDESTTTIATETTEATDTTETTTATETTAATETTPAPDTTTGSSSFDSPLYAALEQSAGVQSARIEGAMTMTGVPGLGAGGEVSMKFSGEFDNATGNSSFIMDLGDFAGAAPGGEEIPAEFADLFGEMEIRTIGETSYMRFGLFSMLGINTEWVSMPVEEAGSTVSSFGAGPTNPVDFMDAWQQVGSDVEELGTESVRGVDTTHYRIVVDAEALADAADDATAEDLESLGAFPGGTMPVEFWVGADGNVYRVLMEIASSGDAATSGFESMSMLWEMYDFGAGITVEPPPADQVTDGSDLTGMFGG